MIDKERLEYLKAENRKYIRHRVMEENELFQDCLKILGEVKIYEAEEDISRIIHSMCGSFPFNEFGQIEGAYELFREDLDFVADQSYFILWDERGLPALECQGKAIWRSLDDIFAVSFDTYIFPVNCTEIIHSDGSGVLWRYF